jgi:hypothetical protein
MFSLFNQYSYLIAFLMGGGILAIILGRAKSLSIRLRVGLLAAYALTGAAVWAALLFPGTDLESAGDVDAILNDGRPTFVMLYSDY